MKKRVLITGSSGFLGKNISLFLKDRGFDVKPFDKEDGQDLLNEKDLEKSLSKVEYVCHLGAVGDVYLAAENPMLAANIGVGGTANLVRAVNKLGGVKKIIYASTWEVYGHPQYEPLDEKHPCNPDHPYSIAKYGGELMLKSKLNHVPWIILRLGSAYGPHMRQNAVIPLFINKAKNGEKIILSGDGLQTRQFTYSEDIAKAFEAAIKSNVGGEIFNVIAGETQTIKQIAEMVKVKVDVEIEYGLSREGDVPPAKVSAEKIRKVLGWSPQVKFNDGFERLFKSLN